MRLLENNTPHYADIYAILVIVMLQQLYLKHKSKQVHFGLLEVLLFGQLVHDKENQRRAKKIIRKLIKSPNYYKKIFSHLYTVL